MAAETEQTGWKIDGRVYEDPEKFTTAEHRIIKHYTKLDFNALERKNGKDLMADQDFLAALMHIAYRREHRDLSFEEIEEIVGDVDLESAMSTLGGGTDADPPALTSKPDESSERSSTGSSETSGNNSSESSDQSDRIRSLTTTAESGTSSQVSVART